MTISHHPHAAFSLPPFPLPPSLLANIRQTTAAALTAIALTFSSPSTAPLLPPTPIPASCSAPQISKRVRYACAPVVVFDKDYANRLPSIWQFQVPGEEQPDISPSLPTTPPPPASQPITSQTSPLPSRPRLPVLPPGPMLASELRILTRLLVALVVGGIIGMERRAANSLAGVRTFSLVSLGAAIFMSTTLVSFPQSDPTRVAAAISSSVGFLGAGAMYKNSDAKHSRGLTTASSVWLAAALGIAAACGMFLLSFTGAISTVLIARYARFDSSLHLIRGNPLGTSDDDEDMEPDSDAYPTRPYGYMQRNDLYEEKRLYEMQHLVDADPSNQKGYSGGVKRTIEDDAEWIRAEQIANDDEKHHGEKR